MFKWLVNILIQGWIEATAFKTTGGTSSQFVKGNGSLDNNTYALDSDLQNHGLQEVTDINASTNTDTFFNNSLYGRNLKSKSFYHTYPIYTSNSDKGVLIETDIPSTTSRMFYLKIEGQSYSGNFDYFTIFSGYNFGSNNLISINNLALGKRISVKVFIKDSKINFYIDNSEFSTFSSFYFSLGTAQSSTTYSIVNVSMADFPATGVTELNDVAPEKYAWLSSDFNINDYLTESESDGRYLLNTTDTFTGDLDIIGNVFQDNGNYVFRSDGTNFFAVTRNGTTDGSTPFIDFLNSSTFNLIRSVGDLVIRAGDVGSGVPTNERFRFKTNGEFQATGGNSTQWNEAYSWGDFRDFGLGSGDSENPSINDMNTLGDTPTRLFQEGNAPANWNTNYGDFPMGVSWNRGTAVKAQLGIGFGANGRLAFRNKTGISAWSPWKGVWHSGDFTQSDINSWNNALQPNDLNGYATESWVNSQGFLDSVPTLDEVTASGNTTGNNIKVGEASRIGAIEIDGLNQGYGTTFTDYRAGSQSFSFAFADENKGFALNSSLVTSGSIINLNIPNEDGTIALLSDLADYATESFVEDNFAGAFANVVSSNSGATLNFDDVSGNFLTYALAASQNQPSASGTAGGGMVNIAQSSVGNYQMFLARGDSGNFKFRNEDGVWHKVATESWVDNQNYLDTVPTLQDVMNAGSTLTSDETIDVGSNTFRIQKDSDNKIRLGDTVDLQSTDKVRIFAGTGIIYSAELSTDTLTNHRTFQFPNKSGTLLVDSDLDLIEDDITRLDESKSNKDLSNLNDSGWQTVTYTSATDSTSSDIRVKKIGNKLYINGYIFYNAGNVTTGEYNTMFVLPPGYRPNVIRQFSYTNRTGANTYEVQPLGIGTSGEIEMYVKSTYSFDYIDLEFTQDIGSF